MLVWLVGGFSRENGIEWLRNLLVAVALALLVRWPLVEPFKIPSGSMKPTFEEGDRIFVNKWVYGVRFPFDGAHIPLTRSNVWYVGRRIWPGVEPQRGDVVVFRSVEKAAKHGILVKRVVGLPGETVHLSGGRVFVNGVPLTEPAGVAGNYYTSPSDSGSPFSDMRYGILEDAAHAIVPDGCFFLLGDNSAHSRDGRVFGWVPNEYILGRVACIWWPVSRWRDLTGFSQTGWWRAGIVLTAGLVFVRLFLGRLWFVHTRVSGKPLAQGDHLYISRWPFGLPIPFTRWRFVPGRKPKRGELVLYHRPKHALGVDRILLGQMAGLPGEEIHIADGKLYINGVLLREPVSLAERTLSRREGTEPYARSKSRQYNLVPEGHYFVLAPTDDPDSSPDSRILGWIASGQLIGLARWVCWPPRRWRRVG